MLCSARRFSKRLPSASELAQTLSHVVELNEPSALHCQNAVNRCARILDREDHPDEAIAELPERSQGLELPRRPV